MKTLVYEEQDHIGVLKLNRPQALNALNGEVIGELKSFFSDLPKTLRCLILTGEGKAFVAGADIKEFSEFSQDQALKMAQAGQQLMNLIEDAAVPVIAAVNGFALGGGLELALSCDFILASDKAKMGLPEVSLGVIPGYGGTQRLSRAAGLQVAKLVTLSGDIFSAEEFARWGVVTKVFAHESLLDEAKKIAKTIVGRSPTALRFAKRSVREGFNLERNKGMELEAKLFAETFNSQDQKEGVKAFLEKRTPNFKGH